MLRVIIFIPILILSLFCYSQSINEYSKEKQTIIQKDLYYMLSILASDSLEGREAGTRGEIMARDFIAQQFKEAGISPINYIGYFLPFDFSQGYSYSKVELSFAKQRYQLTQDFSLLNTYTDYNFNGLPIYIKNGYSEKNYKQLNVINFEENILLLDVNFSDTCKNLIIKQEYYNILQEAIYLAAQKNPIAIVLLSSDFENFPLNTEWLFRVDPLTIPVIIAGEKLSNNLLAKKNDIITCTATFQTNNKKGYNVAAMIDNGKSSYIVFGAHYDHLGYGGNISRYNGPKAIHNGADDNASGTALIIELAKQIKNGNYSEHNYVFIAFSAEEKGLLGSKAFLEQNHIDQSSIIAMLNFDMVGRVDSTKAFINIIGTGTSSEWDSLIEAANPDIMTLKLSKSGLSGSDHLSFYLKDIPVLFFITGLHSDYHKPSDDIEKINFSGMTDVVYLAENIFASLNNCNKLNFQKTDKNPSSRPSRKGPTLGIIPDLTGSDKGLRIDGIIDGKPASKGGLKTGDIIIKLGEEEVSDIMTYMKALSTFKKGESTEVHFIRNDEKLTTTITF